MEHKRIISPLILIGLFAAFGLVCLMVWIRKGKPERWISRKMKLGAAIIAITSVSTGCPPEITCYDPVPQNWFTFDSLDHTDYSVVADLPNDSVLTGKVYDPTFDNYRFEIMTLDSQFVDQGNIESVDGTFTVSTKAFKMSIDSAIDTGSYRLAIYTTERNGDENGFVVYQSKLKIK